MSGKKKYFRFLPLLGGIITLVLSFIASIPFGSTYTLSFHILESNNLHFYIWGIIESGSIWFDFSLFTLDNLIPLLFWIFFAFAGICGLIGISYTENPSSVKKLLLVGGFTISIEFLYFLTLYFLNFGSYSFGPGFYTMIGIILIYFVSAGLVTNYQK